MSLGLRTGEVMTQVLAYLWMHYSFLTVVSVRMSGGGAPESINVVPGGAQNFVFLHLST